MGHFERKKEYQVGVEGEEVIEELLKSNGYGTIPSHKYSDDGAPAIDYPDGEIVLPDIITAGDGDMKFVEVKTKNEIHVQHNQDDERQHGIPKRLWTSYNEIQEKTGFETWLFVFETQKVELDFSTDVCFSTLDNLSIRRKIGKNNPGWKKYGEDMVFFARNQFNKTVSDGGDLDGFELDVPQKTELEREREEVMESRMKTWELMKKGD